MIVGEKSRIFPLKTSPGLHHPALGIPSQPNNVKMPPHAPAFQAMHDIREGLKPPIHQVNPSAILASATGALVDPATLQTRTKVQPEINPAAAARGNKMRGLVAVGTLAALVISFWPKIALAGPLGGLIAGLTASPLGIITLCGIGLLAANFFVKHHFGFDRTMEQRNANPGDSTLRKELVAFSIIPMSLLTGGGLLYLGASLLPWGAAPAFFCLAGAGLVYGMVRCGVSIAKSIRSRQQTITPGFRAGWRQIFETNILSHAVQGAEAAYAFYRAATVFELFCGIAAYVGGSIATVTAAGLAIGALEIGLPLFLALSLRNRFTARKWNELQHDFGPRYDLSSWRGIRRIALTAVGCAVAGALLANFAPILINAVLALAFFFTEVHALVHNWSCQRGSRDVIQTPPNEFSDTEVFNAARRFDSPWITVMKPGIDPVAFVTPTYAMLFLRHGVSWDFNIIQGAPLSPHFRTTVEVQNFLRGEQEQVLEIIQRHRAQADACATLPERYEVLAQMYECLAHHWEVKAEGDFSRLTCTSLARRSDVFGTEADEPERYLGELIRYEGRKFLAVAGEMRHRQRTSQAEIDERLNVLERQFSVILHWFPSKQFRNLRPMNTRSKIRGVDHFNELTMTYETGASVLKRNLKTARVDAATGQSHYEHYWEILPCRRVRRLDPHTNTLSWVDRTEEELAQLPDRIRNIQNRQLEALNQRHTELVAQAQLTPAEQGELGHIRDDIRDLRHQIQCQSYSEIAYIDNRGMADPAGPIHTPQAYTYQQMNPGEWISVVYKNGRVETFTMQPDRTIQVTDNGIARPAGADEVVGLPGMPLAPAVVADLPEKLYKVKGGGVHDALRPQLFHFFKSRYQTMCDGEHADITVPDFLAPLERDLQDPYLFTLWRVPEEVRLPWRRDLQDCPEDRLERISPSYANFCLRVTEKDTGRVLYIPYNDSKLHTPTYARIWAGIQGVRLMSRDDFRATFGEEARDGHGDKLPNVIVAYSGRECRPDQRIGTLPYSYFLGDPARYSAAAFDRALGRIGDMNFAAFTFRRADGSRYMRWLPKEEDWPELEFDPRYESFEFGRDSVLLRTCRFIGKRLFFDRHRLGMDAGNHACPNFEVLDIQRGPQAFLTAAGLPPRTRTVLCRVAPNGQRNYSAFARSVNLENVVEQRRQGNNLVLTRITPADRRVVPLDLQLHHPSNWVSNIAFSRHPRNHHLVNVTVSYTNPYEPTAGVFETETFEMAASCFPDVDRIYQNGNNARYLPRLFDQRQRDRRTGEVSTRLFAVFHTQETETVNLPTNQKITDDDQILLITPNTSVKIRHLNNRNGRQHNDVEWIPFDQELPRASQATLHFNPLGGSLTSGLSFGHVDTMVGPQHLTPLRYVRGGAVDDLIRSPLFGAGLAGPEWATDDQKFYFGEIEGEYNWFNGWVVPEKMPFAGSRGPFSLQYAKSLDDAALNTGSNTLMRSPHEGMMLLREELEIYADQDGMPVDLYKQLYDKTSITEDAQGAWERQRIFDLKTENDPTVRTAGASVNNSGEAMGQRGRWAAMIIFIQRAAKIFWDELIRARLLHRIPPQYTNRQLHQWFNTFTWYLDTIFKHVVPLIPLAYCFSLSPLPAGVIVFPLIWFLKFITGWPKYSSDNQKVGVARIRSYFRNLALYYLHIPNISRNTSHIFDEAKGPFLSTAGSGGRTFFPWALRRIVYYFGGLSLVTTGIGIYRMVLMAKIAALSSVGASASAVAFGLMMNVVWPAFMLLGVAYALKMVWNEMNYRFDNNIGDYRNGFRPNPLQPESDTNRASRWRMFRMEFLEPLTICWFRELVESWRNAIRYYRRGEM